MGLLPALLSLSAPAWGGAVLLLDHSAAPAEDRFHEELALSLDAVALRPAPSGFPDTPLDEQLDYVRPMLREEQALAVVWLDADDPAQLALSVAFVSEDRAVVRLLELPQEPGAEARLALAARELLAQEGMLDSLDAIDITENPSPEMPPPPEGPWALEAGLGVVLPLHADAGGWRVGLDGVAERRVGPVGLQAGLDLQAGQAQLRVGPRLGARLGPVVVGVGADWTRLEPVTLWQPRVELALVGARPSGLGAELRLGITPLRDQVLDGQTVRYDSGWIELGVNLRWRRNISGG